LNGAFVDFFEPDATFTLLVGLKVAAGMLLAKNQAKPTVLGVKFSRPELLMEKRERKWKMDDFWQTVKRDLRWKMDEFWQTVGSIAPTLLLVEMRNGTECGGIAGVPAVLLRRAAGQGHADRHLSVVNGPVRAVGALAPRIRTLGRPYTADAGGVRGGVGISDHWGEWSDTASVPGLPLTSSECAHQFIVGFRRSVSDHPSPVSDRPSHCPSAITFTNFEKERDEAQRLWRT
jgi:hypothetical protein